MCCPLKRNGSWKITGWSSSAPLCGRCSSVVRSFLKQHGKELDRVAYVLTRGSEHRSEDIYRQMDQYTGKPHQAATSLRVGHVGHTFWQEEFLRQIRELLAEEE